MKRTVAFGLVAALLVSAPGCGSPDSLMKELVINLNVLAEVIEKRESREKYVAACERVNATADKIDKLKLSKEQQDALFAKHDADLRKVKERLEAAQKACKLEGGPDYDLPPIVVDGFIKK